MEEILFSQNSCYVTKILQLFTSCKYLTRRIWIILYCRCESHVIPCHHYPAVGKLLKQSWFSLLEQRDSSSQQKQQVASSQIQSFRIPFSPLHLSPVSFCSGARLSLPLISNSSSGSCWLSRALLSYLRGFLPPSRALEKLSLPEGYAGWPKKTLIKWLFTKGNFKKFIYHISN